MKRRGKKKWKKRKKRNINGEEKKRDQMLEKEERKQTHKCYMYIVHCVESVIYQNTVFVHAWFGL